MLRQHWKDAIGIIIRLGVVWANNIILVSNRDP